VICIGFVFIVLCIFISQAGGYLVNSEQHNRDYLVWDHKYTYKFDQQELAIETLKSLSGGESGEQALRTGKQDLWMMTNIYEMESSKGNIWTLENIQHVWEVENWITLPKEQGGEGRWKDFCFAQSITDPSCSKSESLLSPTVVFTGQGFSMETLS